MPNSIDHTRARKPMFLKLIDAIEECARLDKAGDDSALFHKLREVESRAAKIRQHVEDNGQ